MFNQKLIIRKSCNLTIVCNTIKPYFNYGRIVETVIIWKWLQISENMSLFDVIFDAILNLDKNFIQNFAKKFMTIRQALRKIPSFHLRDDTNMTSMKIAHISRPPTSLVHLRPKFFHPRDLGRPTWNAPHPPPPPPPPSLHHHPLQMTTNQLK